MDEQGISWEVLTHVHRDRTNDWYWALGLIALVGAGLSIWLGNMLFGVLILLCAGSIGMLAARGPREHSVHINERGVSLDGTLYPYRSIHSFWVEEGNDNEFGSRLFITTSGIIMPRMTLPLDDRAHAGQVRSYLKRYVKEEEQEPHFGEHIAELLGL